ncbi:TPA: hypothetical protein F3L06_19655 [Aeromonas hydrophila]|nr:hypothetical protein [Aeromonas hydrophila]
MAPAAGAGRRFFGTRGGLLSPGDIERLIDIVPLAYSVTTDEIMGWSVPAALRRYELALAKLGVKRD